MSISALLVIALVGCASAATWRCYRTGHGDTVCIGRQGEPSISPPSISIPPPIPPCAGPAVVYTPQCLSQSPPCPTPSPEPYPEPPQPPPSFYSCPEPYPPPCY